MALQRDEVLRELWRVLSDIDVPDQGRKLRVHSASEDGDDGLQEVYNEFPCAVVWPGPGKAPHIEAGGHIRYEYSVRVHIYESSSLVSERTASALPLLDRVIEKLALNIGLAGSRLNRLVTYCKIAGDSGLVKFEFDFTGEDGQIWTIAYAGYEVMLDVRESTSITVGLGDQ